MASPRSPRRPGAMLEYRPWTALISSMRRLARSREMGPGAAHLAAADLASIPERWLKIPPAPPGMALAWPLDVVEIAEELGLEPDRRDAAQIDAFFDAARFLPLPYRPAGEIDPRREISPLELARSLRAALDGASARAAAPSDDLHAMVWAYEKAALSGEAAAWRELSEVYARGIGARPDHAAAERASERGAEAGDRVCALATVRRLMDQERDPERARRLLAPLLADDPTGEARVLAGYMAYRGFGEPMDRERSERLHREAAALGNADAMFELYVFATAGERTPSAEALEWCRRAAELDQPRACYNMGTFHATGRGLPQDWRLAVQWYERAARLGHLRAGSTLATMYRTGEGVDVDLERAAEWAKLSDGLDWST